MPKIVGALLCRDEATPDRYLRRAVENALSLCDSIVCVDDGSQDDTVEVLQEYGERVSVASRPHSGSSVGFWGNDETTPRALLWDLAAKEAGPDGWIYIFDADHELVGINRPDFRTLCETTTYNTWSFPLWDCWDSEDQMRVGGWWQAQNSPRPWLFKAVPFEGFEPEWQARKIHAGHAPANFPVLAGLAPAAIKHLGYVKKAHRLSKWQRYVKLGSKLTPDEMEHARSVNDTDATLTPVPPARITRILCAIPIRKPPIVVNALLQTLAWQRFREKVQLDFLFLPNFAPHDLFAEESMDLLSECQGLARARELPGQVTILPNSDVPAVDYADGPTHRVWTKPAFDRMAGIKNQLIQAALGENYDYLWLLDADVLCDPYTGQALLDSADNERAISHHNYVPPIVAGVYWTDWEWQIPEASGRVHCGPQVWLRHPYLLWDAQWTEVDFRKALINRRRIGVRGLGACTLIHHRALEKGLNFNRNPTLADVGGMSEGEDRHFCANAQRLHLQLIGDAWSDIYHAYHPQEYPDIGDHLVDLERKQSETPNFGDLVSAKIELLEPVPDQAGRMMRINAQWIRGRLGSLGTLPQVEERLGRMKIGEHCILKMQYPSGYMVPQLSLQTKLARLTLFDAKPFGVPPTISRELFVDGNSGRWMDTTQYTQDQLDAVAEGANPREE